MFRSLSFLLGFLIPAPALADVPALELRGLSSARVIAGEEGERMLPARAGTAPLPGEERLFTLSFFNPATTPAAGLRLEFALPAGLAYVPGSANGPGTDITLSADGGASFEEESALGDRAAGASHLRWTFRAPLYPRTTGIVSFRGRALPPPTLPAEALPVVTDADAWPAEDLPVGAGEPAGGEGARQPPASSPTTPPRPPDDPARVGEDGSIAEPVL